MKIRYSLSFILSTCFISATALAAPLLTITPADYTYHDQALALGTTVKIPYTITNNSSKQLSRIVARNLPYYLRSSTCDTLAPGDSCTLTLTIPARFTTEPGNIRKQFKVCARSRGMVCTPVSAAYQLNINITRNQTFLAIADIHLKDGAPLAVKYGLDTGDPLWTSARAKLTTLINEQAPKYIVLLGDLPAHHDTSNLGKNIGAVLTGLSGLDAISANNMPVFYVFGNNDSVVRNYGEFSDGVSNLFSFDPAHNSPASRGWPALNANPDCNVSNSSACTYTTTSPMSAEHAADMAYAQTRGYYSAYPLGSATPLRLIALNSIIFSHEFALTGEAQLKAAQEQFDWLSAQLAAASAKGEAVYIAMHIPVGTDAFNHDNDMWNDTLLLSNGLKFRDAFLALAAQYKNTIRIVMSAHTHLGELRALYADNTLTNVSVLSVGVPGITPVHYNNPGMQVYLYDRAYNLTESKTFFTTPNSGTWSTYSFQDDYNCPPQSTLLTCFSTNVLSQLPAWKEAPQPLMNNPYENDYSVRVQGYNPANGGYSSWLSILNAIQVVPTQ